MELQQRLDSKRSQWKELVATHALEDALTTVLSEIKPQSPRRDGLVGLVGQYRQIETDDQKGILRYEEKLLQLNRIRHQLLDWLDGLNASDLGWSPAREHKWETAPTREKALDDLRELDESRRELLSFYPRIYRALREKVIRNDQKDPGNEKLRRELREALPTLETLYPFLQELHHHSRSIKLATDRPAYWRELKGYLNLVSEINLSDWQRIADQRNAILEFHQRVKEIGLIS